MKSDLKLKKSLGQNFLIDRNIINKIKESLNIERDSLIIEIGPGSGALTKELIKFNTKVLCFEIDKRLKEILDEIKSENLEIIYEDFLKVDLKKILTEYKYNKLYVIANIPYYITSSIINKVIDETNVDEMVLMVQKEVGDRILAQPNSRDYGSLSVFLQFNFKIEKVIIVSKNSFKPRPKVDSMVLKFTSNKNKYNVKSISKLYDLIRESFKHKRKNLKNNLYNYDLNKINNVLKKHGKDLTFRAESLTIEEFIDISNEIS